MNKPKLSEIKEAFEKTEITLIPETIKLYEEDDREGVRKILARYQSIYDKYNQELIRIDKLCEYEKQYGHCQYIAGVDEVGRGPLAGPVVTCAVILPKDEKILYVNDSKKLSEKKREELYDIIMEKALDVSIGIESPSVIDDINILQATLKAMSTSVNDLKYKPDIVFVDAVKIPNIDSDQLSIIKGDAKSISIACASIIAKVTRDRMMEEYDELYPQYDFKSNKGYGSAHHIEALKKYGPCPIHRHSFIKSFI